MNEIESTLKLGKAPERRWGSFTTQLESVEMVKSGNQLFQGGKVVYQSSESGGVRTGVDLSAQFRSSHYALHIVT